MFGLDSFHIIIWKTTLFFFTSFSQPSLQPMLLCTSYESLIPSRSPLVCLTDLIVIYTFKRLRLTIHVKLFIRTVNGGKIIRYPWLLVLLSTYWVTMDKAWTCESVTFRLVGDRVWWCSQPHEDHATSLYLLAMAVSRGRFR